MALGIARLQAGRIAESLEGLRTAVRLAPEHADAHSNLAHALFFSGPGWIDFFVLFKERALQANHRP